MAEKKLNGTVIVTYRCNARCTMCNRYKAPSKAEEEITIETIKKLPPMYFTNITGGEPFIRTDLKEIVRELYKKSDRIVISTNGFFIDKIIELCKEFPQIGIRISIEGLEQTNNEIRGLNNGYQRGYNTLKELRKMGMKDVGFGMTVQDKNAPDLLPLYKISNEMGMDIYALLAKVAIAWPAALHVYFDLFSGAIQTYVFCMLTMTYITDACTTEE